MSESHHWQPHHQNPNETLYSDIHVLEQWYLWWAFTLLSLRLSSLFDLSWYPPTNDHPWPNMLLLAGPPYCFQTTPALIMTQRAITAEQVVVWNYFHSHSNWALNIGENSGQIPFLPIFCLLSQVRNLQRSCVCIWRMTEGVIVRWVSDRRNSLVRATHVTFTL